MPSVSTEEMRDQEVYTTPPELQILLGPGLMPSLDNPPVWGGGDQNGGLLFPFPDIPRRGWKEGEDRIPRPKDPVIPSVPLFPDHREPEEVQGSVDVAVSVKCDSDKMTVAVDKDSFQVGGSVQTLKLSPASCNSAFIISLSLFHF